MTPVRLAEICTWLGEIGDHVQHVRIVDLDLRNLLVQDEEAAGVDDHFQMVVVARDVVIGARRVGVAGDGMPTPGGDPGWRNDQWLLPASKWPRQLAHRASKVMATIRVSRASVRVR